MIPLLDVSLIRGSEHGRQKPDPVFIPEYFFGIFRHPEKISTLDANEPRQQRSPTIIEVAVEGKSPD